MLSYFIFLRWLFLLNLLIFFLVFLFIFIPQVIYRPSIKYSNLTSFHGTDLLDGRVRILQVFEESLCDLKIVLNENTNTVGIICVYLQGWFHGTELYYGYYTNETIPISDRYGYEMPLAYLLTCASYLLLCLVIMVTR